MEKLIWLAPILAVIALIFAAAKALKISKAPAGTAHMQEIAALDLDGYAARGKPNSLSRGVVDRVTVSREFQRAVCLDVFVDLHIVCVPDVVTIADILSEFLYDLPVIVCIKLVGVTPKIEESGIGVPEGLV